jgi:hypothetical protein
MVRYFPGRVVTVGSDVATMVARLSAGWRGRGETCVRRSSGSFPPLPLGGAALLLDATAATAVGCFGSGPHLSGGAGWPAPSPDAVRIWREAVVVLRQEVLAMAERRDFNGNRMCGAAAEVSLGWGDRGGGAGLPY